MSNFVREKIQSRFYKINQNLDTSKTILAKKERKKNQRFKRVETNYIKTYIQIWIYTRDYIIYIYINTQYLDEEYMVIPSFINIDR